MNEYPTHLVFKKHTIKTFFLFVFLFFNIYPFKVGSVNLGFFCNIILLMFFAGYNNSLSYFLKKDIFYFSIFLFLFSIITYFLTLKIDSFLLARNVRIVLSTITISLLFDKLIYSKKQFVNILKLVLLVNVLVVIFQFVFPETRNFFAPIVGYDKKLVPFRSFGVFNSFDYAGFYCLFSLVVFSIVKDEKFKIFNSIAIIFSIVSCFLTSRTTMVFCIVLIFYLIYLNRNKIRFVHLLLAGYVIANVLIEYINLLILVLTVSFPDFGDYFGISIPQDVVIADSYGNDSANALMDDMIVFPKGYDLFFGLGLPPKNSDIGYIHLLFLYGLMGTIFIVLYHLYVFFKGIKILYKIREHYIYRVYFIFALLLIIYNYKLTFITGSGIYELFLILYLFIFYLKKSTHSSIFMDKN
ncbi:hypothetical protein [Flavobacterium adhaerens]|uniref:hypothetical protein n=1 Tax=Flavobacterium adhaerens TaxID=3149043 RepID=UPI0032B4FB7B